MHESTHWSSNVSGTSDCRYSVTKEGSSPQASQDAVTECVYSSSTTGSRTVVSAW